MMSKRFLVPVLILAGFGLPAGAAVVQYCSGSGCGVTTEAAFNNAVTVGGYAFDGPETFNVSGDLSGYTYTDLATGIIFQNFTSGSVGGSLTDTGGVLSTPNGDNSILITIPNTILAISLTINVTQGLCDSYCAEGETTGFLGFINNDSPTSSWTVGISPLSNGGYTEISSFNAAAPGVSNSDTPEVGTLLLIGLGLIAMRWMRRVPLRVFRTLRPA
jgi:hypothetical protein